MGKAMGIHKMTSLNAACWVSTPKVIKALLDIGADPMHVNDHGSTCLMGAVSNPYADASVFQPLCDRGQHRVMNEPKRARTMLWRLFFGLSPCQLSPGCEQAYCCSWACLCSRQYRAALCGGFR